MRKAVAALFISLDGVTESPEKWQFDHFDEDMAAGLASQIAAEDAVLLARDLSGVGGLLANFDLRAVCQPH